MLTQLGFFPGASAAWFQLTGTLTHAFGPGKQKCPRLLAGAGQNAPANKRGAFLRRVPAKAEFRRLDNSSGGIGSQRERGRLR